MLNEPKENLEENRPTERFDGTVKIQWDERRTEIAKVIELKKRTFAELKFFLIIPPRPPETFLMDLLREEDIKSLSGGIDPAKLQRFLTKRGINATMFPGKAEELKKRVQEGELAGKIFSFRDKSEPLNAVIFTQKDKMYVFASASIHIESMTLLFFASNF